MPRRLIKTLRASARALAFTAALCLSASATADSVKRGKLPTIEGITIIGVQDGELVYRTAAGEVKAPLSEITGLGIDSAPAFNTGLAALNEGKLRNAQKDLAGVWQDSRVDWVKQFAGYYLLQVYDKRNEPVLAGETFAQLAATGADVFFLSKPPVASLAEADEDQKKRIKDQILAVMAEVKGDSREKLRTYLNAVAGEEVVVEQNEDEAQASRDQAQRNASAVIIPERVWKMVDRKGEPKGKWDGIGLLSQGKFTEVLDHVKKWQENPGGLAPMLFIKGRAQLALADEKKDEKLYKDAGLTFMRIVVHFDRQGTPDALVPAAKLEVAYIHKQIGRQGIYEKIIRGDSANPGVYILLDDEESYPQYRKRYYQVIGEKPPAE